MKRSSNKILVVDDQPSICRLIQEMLVRKGYDVTIANSYGHAEDKLANQEFGVVISDIYLEQDDHDGIALLQHIQTIHPGLL